MNYKDKPFSAVPHKYNVKKQWQMKTNKYF